MTLLNVVGNTSIMSLGGIHVKLEYLNPSGSIKDRIAKYIVEKAEKTKKLKPGYTIVEATSGNTGIAFSMVAALKGYKMIAVMPKGLSEARAKIMKEFGARVLYVKKDCFSCAIKKAEEIGRNEKTYLPRQFENPWNPQEHKEGLAQEILKQLPRKKIDAVVAGVGTGGTLVGVGKALKKKFPKAQVFAVEPDECPLLTDTGFRSISGRANTKKECKHHGIEGISDGIIPKIIKKNKSLINGVIDVKTKDAVAMSHQLSKQGYFVGPSSGANLIAAIKLRNSNPKKFKNIVTFFCDSGDRYLN